MFSAYEWNPMPHKIDVKCPNCQRKAIFEFAEIVKIKLKKDIEFFEKSKVFDYKIFSNSGQKWHAAIFYAGLQGSSTEAIHELPEGYSATDWDHSEYLVRTHTNKGSIRCGHCFLNQKHILDWPKEAYFLVAYRGKELWAFNQETAQILRDYIKAELRDLKNQKWRAFLMKVPTEFLKKNARDSIIKSLDKLL